MLVLCSVSQSVTHGGCQLRRWRRTHGDIRNVVIFNIVVRISWISVNFPFLLAAGVLSPVLRAKNRERARSLVQLKSMVFDSVNLIELSRTVSTLKRQSRGRTTQDTPHGTVRGGYSQLKNSPGSSWLRQPRVTNVPNLYYAPISSESSGSAPTHSSISRTEG